MPPYAGISIRQPVDPKNRYYRAIAIVPYIGSGTRKDPRRPMYTPAPDDRAPSLKGILGFQQIPTDDKKYAIVEFVAADPAVLTPILNDKSLLRVFEKGKTPRATIELAVRLFRKDFDLSQFGMAVR